MRPAHSPEPAGSERSVITHAARARRPYAAHPHHNITRSLSWAKGTSPTSIASSGLCKIKSFLHLATAHYPILQHGEKLWENRRVYETIICKKFFQLATPKRPLSRSP
ncbi:unnamed protein product [Colias eurytheme]|nr:unnamed protein product [Colias eurytheme]